MSRFFSFMKKKGDKDGELPVSPPPSPLSKSKSESEGKSVKQVKKRSNKRERRKRPVGASEDGSSLETEPGELISTDANGNSMTGKVRSSANANAGEMVLRITAAEGDCDSLGDVDSISEEEIANGKIAHSSPVSQVQAQTEIAPHEESPNDVVGNVSQDLKENVVSVTNEVPKITVEKVSCSGTNDAIDDDLMDDFMDEAFDDLETDSPNKGSPIVCDEETPTDGNVTSLNGGSPTVTVNETPPREKNNETGDVCSKEDNFDEHSVVVRPLSTDTAVTHYSSCEPGSDVFDSASEEFHDALQHEPQNDILSESDSQSPEDFGEVILRKEGLNTVNDESCDGDDVKETKKCDVSQASAKNLEICFEVASQGRTSILVEDIIEARNQISGVESPLASAVAGAPASNGDSSVHLDRFPDCELSDDLDRDTHSSHLKNSDSELSLSVNADPVAPVSDSENSTLPLNEDCASGGEARLSTECAVVGDDPSSACDKEDSTCRPIVSEKVNELTVDQSASSHTDLGSSETSCHDGDEAAVEEVDCVEIKASGKIVQPSENCESAAHKVLNPINFTSADESTNSNSPNEIGNSIPDNEANPTCVGEKSSNTDTTNMATNNEINLSSADDQKSCTLSEEGAASPRISSLCSDSSGSNSVSCNGVGAPEALGRDKQKADRVLSSTSISDDASPRSSSRSSFKKQMSLEDELSKYDDKKIKAEAEARLAQRRAARAEARELRLRELEKQQQQNPETNDDASDMSDGGSGGRASNSRTATATTAATANNGHHHTAGTVPPPPPLPHYTRHSSEESNPDDPATSKDIRELEEKFRGAMISNAQLDNEKSQLTYQVELLKDVRADITEQLTQLKKEHKKKCSEHEQLRKVYAKLQEESRRVRRVLEQRDELIQEYGLVVVSGGTEGDEEDEDDEDGLAAREETEEGLVLPRPVPMKRVLLSQEASEILEKGAAKGSLEWRLRRVVEHKRELEDELRRVNLELEEQVNNQRQSNCVDSNIQKEANKTVSEYKFRVQRAEAEVSSLQANVNRLDVLVTRYKTQVEELEKSEEELKLEKRKLQRERRELQEKSDELESSKNYIKRQYEKLLHDRQGARH